MLNKIVPLPRQYQYDAFNYLQLKRSAALAMEQGLGKTKVCLMYAEYLYNLGVTDRILVICPNSLKYQWVEDEPNTHLINDFKGMFWDNFVTKKRKKEFDCFLLYKGLKIFSVNYEAFSSNRVDKYIIQYLKDKEALIVCDESTEIKNPKALRTIKILSRFIKRKYKVILSGTLLNNSPFDLWPQYEFLYPNFWGMDYSMFIYHHAMMIKKTHPVTNAVKNAVMTEFDFNIIKSRLNKIIKDKGRLTEKDFEYLSDILFVREKDLISIHAMGKFTPYKNLTELRNKMSKVTFYCKKEGNLELPEKIYNKLECELNAEQKRLIKELKSDLMTQYEDKTLTLKSVICLLLRQQMITGGLFPYEDIIFDSDGYPIDSIKGTNYIDNVEKFNLFEEYIASVGDGDTVIVWAIFKYELLKLHEILLDNGKSAYLYYGDTPHNERQEIIENFRQGKAQYLVINPAVGKFGLNLQIANRQLFYSNSWKADNRLQAEDRSHRLGQKRAVIYTDVICRNSVDEKILKALKNKTDLINYLRSNPKEF